MKVLTSSIEPRNVLVLFDRQRSNQMACAERCQWRKEKRNVIRRTPVLPRLAGTSGRHVTRSAHNWSQILSVDAVPRNLTRRSSRTAVNSMCNSWWSDGARGDVLHGGFDLCGQLSNDLQASTKRHKACSCRLISAWPSPSCGTLSMVLLSKPPCRRTDFS